MRRPRISLSSVTWLFLGAVYFVVPLVATLLFSLQSGRNSSYSLSAYGTVLHDHTFWKTLRLSLELSLETIAVSLALLVPTAYWVHLKLPRLKPYVEFMTILPFVVPPIILALANAPVDLSKMKTVKYIFTGAAPLPLDPARKLQDKINGTIVQGYGLTEASPLTHAQPGDPALVRIDSVGMPTHNTEQKIVDIETGERELPVGEDGEIIIRGPQIMQGYWKAPEETARTLRNGWLYTGDIGHVDADGYTFIVDRKKEMIKYKGFGIAPAELESLLMEHPAVLDSAVIGISDPEAGGKFLL